METSMLAKFLVKIEGAFKKIKKWHSCEKTTVLTNSNIMENNYWIFIEKTQYQAKNEF